MGKIIIDTIHTNGIDIGIYTQNFENEFISLIDIAQQKSDECYVLLCREEKGNE